MKKNLLLLIAVFAASFSELNAQPYTFGSWTLHSTGIWPTGAGIQYTNGSALFGISSNNGQVSLQLDGGFRQEEAGQVNYFMDKVGFGITTPTTMLHIRDGVPSTVQALNAATKIAIDAASGGFLEIRNSGDNNTYSGLLFTDNNLGGYVAFRNASDDKLHIGGFGGIVFETGDNNSVGGKTETFRVSTNLKSYFGGYVSGAANANAFSMEIGSSNPTPTSGAGVLFWHHHGVIAHQMRYNGGNLYLEAAGNGYGTSANPNFFVGGRIGIGTIYPDAELAVNGRVHCKEVKVSATVPAPDYVFEGNYDLRPIQSVKEYIQSNKHLPEVPSGKDIEENGIEVGKMDMLLLKKIEELTLYVIELKDQNDKQSDQIKKLEEELKSKR